MWRIVAIVAPAVLMATLVTLPTIGFVYARRAPEVAVAFWPWGAEGNAVLAAGLVSGEDQGTQGSSARIERARKLAQRALGREPVSALAAGVMAVADIAQGREAASRRALAYSESLSRRELLTQIVLIQSAVGRGDVAGALLHYDRALRTSARAPDLLFPVLVAAADQPAVTVPLARLLAARPGWWLPFMLQYAQQSRSPDALAAILAAERLRMDVPLERQAAITGMNRLVAMGKVDLAGRLSDGWQGRPHGLLSDRDFGRSASLPPFGWATARGDEINGIVEDVAGGGRALLLTGDGGGDPGVVARQLVRLPPGRYRLSARTEGLSAGGGLPDFSVTCVSGTKLSANPSAAVSGDVREDRLLFTIPVGCTGQWIEIGVTGSTGAMAPPKVRAVSLAPASGMPAGTK